MGCTSSTNQQCSQQQILPLPRQIVNAYIDRVSIIMINKIKDKFQSQFQNNQTQMQSIQFTLLFKNCQISDDRKKNLFDYFNNNSKNSLKLSKFIQKYCILVKSDTQHFSQIIHKIYCKNVQTDSLSKMQFQNFEMQCQQYIKKNFSTPSLQKFPILWSQFYKLIKDHIDWQSLQNTFHIVSIDQLPFKSFHQELEKFAEQDLIPSQYYYVISSEWFSQWVFFYDYQDTDIRNSTFRLESSKKLIRKNSNRKRKLSKSKLNSSKLISKQDSKTLQMLQPPTQINMTNIQGEYFGQLKPYLSVQRDITIINQKMWNILKSTLGSQFQFRRQAIDSQNIDLYPTSIYFYQTNKYGTIEKQSLKIFQVRRKIKKQEFQVFLNETVRLKSKISQNKQKEQKSYYFKLFGNKCLNFKQWQNMKSIQDFINQNLKVVIVEMLTAKKYTFENYYQRKQINIQNVTVGDEIMAYFSYQDKFIQAEILNVNKKQYKVHFKGFSYNYQRWVSYSSIKMIDTQNNQTQSKNQQNQREKIFQGIQNIGNTCFINSILQSLVSTSIFDKFYLKASLSQRKYPLNYALSKVVKGLIKKQQFDIVQFKKIINKKLPIFSGFDQHDAQQFLNLFLDKIDEQLTQKPNIVDQLFGGKMQSKFTCLKCNDIKTKQQKIHTISLPIPQAEYNFFVVMIFPIYSQNLRKIVMRLHKNAKMSQYLAQIENRTNINRYDMVYVQCQYTVFKKLRNDILIQANEDKKITQLGLNSDIQIWAYQKIRNTSIEYRQKMNMKTSQSSSQKLRIHQYYDLYSNQENCLGIAKIMSIKQKEIIVQFLKDNLIKQITIKKQAQKQDKQSLQKMFFALGTKVNERIFRKVTLRKFSQQTSKMFNLDTQFLIGLPKWASYSDTLVFMGQYLQGLVKPKRINSNHVSKNNSRIQHYQQLDQQIQLNQDQLRLTNLNSFNSTSLNQQKHPYIIHFLQPQKNCCFFCQKQLEVFNSHDGIRKCCQPEDKTSPLYWSGREKYFYFLIDWVQISQFNQSFCNDIKIDKISISAQQKLLNQKISLSQCLDLWKKPQVIELQCQKCKHNEHLLETSILKTPIITIFHLKQFRYTQQGHFIKLNVNLQWQESINLDKYCKNNQLKCMYQMYSVIQHKGSTNSGHYTTLTKRKHPFQKSKVWINCDDHITQVIDQKPATIKNAYLLFFKKVDIPSSAIVHFSI